MALSLRASFRTLIVVVTALAVTGTGATAAHAEPTVDQKIAKASTDLEKVIESFNKATINLKKSRQAEVALRKSLGPAEKAMKTASADMQSIAATSYKQGQVGTLNVLLDGREGLLERMSMLEQMSKSKQKKIDNFETTAENFKARTAALNTTQAKLSAQIKDLQARKTKVEGNLEDLRAMKEAANRPVSTPGSSYSGPVPNIAGSAGDAVSFAFGMIGVMYSWGGASRSGVDCSGLTMMSWQSAGKSLSHSSETQWSETARVGAGEIQPGDLVFYNGLSHVGIFVGGGEIIDASTDGVPVAKRPIGQPGSIDGYGRVS